MTPDDRSHQPCWPSWFISAVRSWIAVSFLMASLVLFPNVASAQATPDPRGSGVASAVQGAEAAEAAYCIDLKRVVVMAMSGERFAAIAGQPLAGNFIATTLVLPGWERCVLYGASTYTCDFSEVGSAQDAERAQAALLSEIKACLGEGWAEVRRAIVLALRRPAQRAAAGVDHAEH